MNALTARLKGLLFALIYTITFVSGQLFADLLLMIPYAIAQYSSLDDVQNFSNKLTELFKTDFLPRYSWLVSILSAAISILLLLIITKFTSRSFKARTAIRKCPVSPFLYIVTLSIGLQILITLAIDSLGSISVFEELIKQQNDYSQAITGNTNKLLELLAVAVAAPLCEELFFRGAVLSSLRENRFEKVSSVLIQALMFAIVHGVPIAMLYAFIMGTVMGWLRIKFDSIWPGICLHSVFNCVAYWSYMGGDELHPISYVLLWLSSAAISISSFILLSRKKTENER